MPRHCGVSGLPDRWGDKSGLWLLPVISFVLYLALTAVSRYVSRYPQMINVPMGIDRGDPGVQKLLLSMTVALKMAIVIGFACISWATVKTALGRSNGLPPWLLPVFLILVAAPLVWYLVRLRRYRSL